MVYFRGLFLFAGLFLPLSLFAQSLPPTPIDYEKRLQDLEKRQAETERRQKENYIRSVENKGDVQSFLGERISFGGYFETAVTQLSGENMRNQLSANSNAIGINIAAEIAEKTRFVSQYLVGLAYPLVNPNNNPAISPSERQYKGFFFGSLVAQAYVEFAESDAFKTQVGIGYVPFGQALQLREPVLFRRRGGPQLNNTAGDTDIGVAFPLWQGVHVLGTLPLGNGRWGYNAYTFSPSSNTGTLAGGGRLWWAPTEAILVGLSSQYGEQQRDEEFFTVGVDASAKFENLGVIAEYIESNVTGPRENAKSYYIEPYVTLKKGKFLIFAAADYLDSPNRVTGLIPDPFEKMAIGGGINWLPTLTTRLRLEYMNHHYLGSTATVAGQGRDYNSVDASAAIAF